MRAVHTIATKLRKTRPPPPRPAPRKTAGIGRGSLLLGCAGLRVLGLAGVLRARRLLALGAASGAVAGGARALGGGRGRTVLLGGVLAGGALGGGGRLALALAR